LDQIQNITTAIITSTKIEIYDIPLSTPQEDLVKVFIADYRSTA
jgi:hypothetical protein